jgi:hypothetical protein
MYLVVLGLISATLRLFIGGMPSSGLACLFESGCVVERVALDCWDEMGEG